MRYEVFVNGEKVTEVEAAGLANARTIARKMGYRFCEIKEARRMLPGEKEYTAIRDYVGVCKGLAHDNALEERKLNADIFGTISRGEQSSSDLPGNNFTAGEIEAAYDYARFLGEVVYREFMSDVNFWVRR